MSGHGNVYWSELMTTDADGAETFYVDLLGWGVNKMSMSDPTSKPGKGEDAYVMWMAGETPAGGMFAMTGDDFKDTPAHWMTYVQVDDVDAAAAKVETLGGSVRKPPCDVPGVGRIAIIADPQGATLGLITPARPS